MPRPAENQLGATFGWLTVIERAPNTPGKKPATAWTCRCLCGNLHVARTSLLKLGKIKSCGCLLRSKKVNGMSIPK